MGTRISKNIGYFLHKKQSKLLLKRNHKKILEALDYDDEKQKAFVEKIMEMMKNHEQLSTAPDAKIEGHMFFTYIHDKDYKWTSYELIRLVYNLDNYHGLLFRTPELVKKGHFDDDIDYYENVHNNFKFKSLLINQPIYPLSGFIFKGTDNPKIIEFLERFKEEKQVKRGGIVQGNILNSLLYILYGKSFDSKDFYSKVRETGAFHPNTDPLVWIIAKASGILLDSVDEIQFRTTIEPAIVTTWG